jgi:O-acetyl-ADP-ribose deacetylase (regulator of RNase III)
VEYPGQYNPIAMERRVAGVIVRVVEDDITRMETDAIVNAANNHFWMGGGVAGAIKRAGGSSIETEAISHGPVPVGESVVTQAGRLTADYVIHAAVMGQDLQTSAQAIRDATGSALERSEDLGLSSIAFPALGTGVGGFPPRDAARVMIEATVQFLRRQDRLRLKEVVFVMFSDQLKTAFADELAKAAAEA